MAKVSVSARADSNHRKPSAGLELGFKPTYKQSLVFDSPAREILFGGASGPGKSWLLRVAAISYCVAVPSLQCYLFRRSYPDLISNHVEGPSGLPALIGPLIKKGLAEYVTCETRFWNGSKIFLRHVHSPTDVYSYQGAEFHLLLIDELSHFSEDIYRFLRSRCRYVTEDPRWRGQLPRIICGSNPGGIGHQFVKRTWIDHGEYRIWQAPADEGGLTRQFIPGRVSDNPYLAECDPDYFKRLAGLGDPLWVRMLLDGDWSIVGGSMFGEEWRREKHVVNPFSIPSSWSQWRSLDDGYHSPACVLWYAMNPDTKRIYVVSELYKAKQTPEMIAEEVVKRDLFLASRSLTGICDTSAFSDLGAGQTRAEVMNRMRCSWQPCTKGPGSRKEGIQSIHRFLRGGAVDGGPGLVFFSNCENAIEILPTLPRSRHDIEDIDANSEDHVSDSLAYGLQYRSGPDARSFQQIRVGGNPFASSFIDFNGDGDSWGQ